MKQNQRVVAQCSLSRLREKEPFHKLGFAESPSPSLPEPVIGPAEGRTRWLGRPPPQAGEVKWHLSKRHGNML
jgi:hypothetical protein